MMADIQNCIDSTKVADIRGHLADIVTSPKFVFSRPQLFSIGRSCARCFFFRPPAGLASAMSLEDKQLVALPRRQSCLPALTAGENKKPEKTFSRVQIAAAATKKNIAF